MNIQTANRMNFKAKYIQPTYVKKLDESGLKYIPEKLSFVKLDKNSFSDVSAITAVAKMWRSRLIEEVASTLEKFLTGVYRTLSYDAYAITTQKKNFQKLDPKKIVCVIDASPELKDKRDIFVYDFEVMPELQRGQKNAAYQKVGKGTIESLKCLCDRITLKSLYSATGFYEANGFKLVNKDKLIYRWER